MLVRSIIIFLLISACSFAQDDKAPTSDDLMVISIEISELEKQEQAFILNKKLTSLEFIFFSSVQLGTGQTYIVVLSDLDISELENKLADMGYTLSSHTTRDFDKEEYYLKYVNHNNYGAQKGLETPCDFIKTGNYNKDFQAYKLAKNIYLEFNTENN